ncbi:MAG: acyltransferase [Sphingomonadaceae bacterium]
MQSVETISSGNARAATAISRPYSLALDLIRVVAALVVVTGHSGQLGVFTGRWPFSDIVQHVAVIVFFVLSGLVISDSVQTRKMSLQAYAIARFSRIFPVAIAGVLLGNFIWFASHLWHIDLPAQPANFNLADTKSVIMPLLFLSETSVGTGPVANPPYWSLCYEVLYYAIFAAFVFLKGPNRSVWTFALLVIAGPRIIILMPVWLAGVWLQSRLSALKPSRFIGLILVLAGSIVVVSMAKIAMPLAGLTASWPVFDHLELRFSQFWLADWFMTPAILAIFIGILPWAEQGSRILDRHARAIRRLAGSSFTLYIIHWPIISLLVALGFTSSNFFGFAAIVVAVVMLAIGVAAILERQITPALKRAMQLRLAGKPHILHS